MDWQQEKNLLDGIGDIVNTSQTQHVEEMNLLNKQHKEVVQELLKQSKSAEDSRRDAIKEAQQQVKYARRAYIIALLALAVSIGFGILQYIHC